MSAASFAGKSTHLRDSPGEPNGIGVSEWAPLRLVGLLGEGGMSQVYLGHHDQLGVQVAVKRLRHHLANLDQARARLRQEAEIVGSLRHEHIVDVLELVIDPAGDTYLVMEHVPGEPLSVRLARTGALPMSETLTIAVQISGALAAVHRRGIIHRDLKTENVLIGVDEDGSPVAKLIDFGAAEIVGGPDGAIHPPTIVGTPESMSPEQARAGRIDRRSDIYSFGVLLYEMVTGGAPFRGDDIERLMDRVVREEPVPPSLMPGAQKQLIPDALEDLILQCLAKRPGDRPRDMDEVCERVERIASGEGALSEALIVLDEAIDAPLPVAVPVPALVPVPVTARAVASDAPALQRWSRVAVTGLLVAALAAGGLLVASHLETRPASLSTGEVEEPWHR